MLEFDFEVLSELGLTPALASRAAAVAVDIDATEESRLHLLRITEVHRETVVVHDGREELSARALPRLFRALTEEETALAVGDWVLASVDRHGQCWVRSGCHRHRTSCVATATAAVIPWSATSTSRCWSWGSTTISTRGGSNVFSRWCKTTPSCRWSCFPSSTLPS